MPAKHISLLPEQAWCTILLPVPLVKEGHMTGSNQWKVNRTDELPVWPIRAYPAILWVYGLLSAAGLDAKDVMEHSET